MASWEMSKENIQPIKSGRRVSAIEEQDSRKLFLKQQEFETALRSCSGNDSLQLWYDYILWIEQHFPKGGKEGNLRSLVHKCLQEFEKSEEVFNDERFLEIWMKHAALSSTPLDVFRHMFNKGICHKRPNYYTNWAWEAENAGYSKQANQIFEKGLAMMETEDDKNELDAKHKQFQTRMFKNLLKGEDEDSSSVPVPAEEERVAFASLRGTGKSERVGSIRIGGVKKSDGPGILMSLNSSNKKPSLGSNGKHISIFQDDENHPPTHSLSQPSSSGSRSVPDPKILNSENDMSAGKWSNAKIGRKSHAVSIEKISSKPTFVVHEDEGSSQAAPTPQKMLSSKVLSVLKPAEEHHVAVALFEPPDPMKKPMYCKHLVYQGVTEFSFEELRAIKVRRKRAEDETKRLEMESKRLKEENRRWKEEQESRNLEREELLRKNLEMMSAIEQQRLEFKRFQDEMKKQQEEAFKQLRLSVKPTKQTSKPTKNFSGKPKKTKTLGDVSPVVDLQPFPTEARSKTPQREMVSVPEKLMEPSPTINTKEALILNHEFWGADGAHSPHLPHPTIYKDPTPSQLIAQPPTSNFEIFEDEPEPQVFSFPKPSAKSCVMKLKPLHDGKENVPLKIYCDDDKPVMDEPPIAHENNDITVLPSEEDFAQRAQVMSTPYHGGQKFIPTWDENTCKVEILAKKPEQKELKGASSLASHVPKICVQPVEDSTNLFPKVTYGNDEMTMQVPSSMEDFAMMARTVSTPHHGHGFRPEPDENTSKVDIFFKVPPSMVNEKEDMKAQRAPEMPNVPVGSGGPACLFTIMETSREEYKSSSSSSSNNSHSVAQFTKSHFGNTHINGSNVSTAVRTPGFGLSSYKASDVTVSSGYIGDNSSARTPGIFLKQTEDLAKMPAPKSVAPLKVNTVFKLPTQVEEKEDELTGPLGELLSEFQRNAGLSIGKPPSSSSKTTPNLQKNSSNVGQVSSVNPCPLKNVLNDGPNNNNPALAQLSSSKLPTIDDDLTLPLSSRKLDRSEYQGRNMKSHSSFLSQSIKVSFLGTDLDVSRENDLKKFDAFVIPSPGQDFDNKTLNVGESSQFLEATHYNIEMSGFSNAQLDDSVFVDHPRPEDFPKLDMEIEGAPILETTNHEGLIRSINRMPSVSSSKLLNQVGSNAWNRSEINPFCPKLHGSLLQSLSNPIPSRYGFLRVAGCVPSIKTSSIVTFADVSFFIMECKGEGGYGKVFKAYKQDDKLSANTTIANKDVVLKVQKPAREWEFYICTEVHSRLSSISPKDKCWFMSIPRSYTFDDGSIFVSDHQNCTLLDVCNQVISMQSGDVEPIALFFVIEMLRIAEVLKLCNVIHADIKPENFLIQNLPKINPEANSAEEMFAKKKPSLQVIDFGISIDLNLFQQGTNFVHSFSKGENMSPDMIEKRPWTFQLDYFGIANVAYILLNSTNMKLNKDKVTGKYSPSGSYKRWWNVELWEEFFDTLLNIRDCQSQPDLYQLRIKLQNFFYDKYRSKFDHAITSINQKLSKIR